MTRICPFLNDFCCEDKCGIFNVANERCSFLLIAEIMASRTDEYRPAANASEPILVKVVKSDD